MPSALIGTSYYIPATHRNGRSSKAKSGGSAKLPMVAAMLNFGQAKLKKFVLGV